MEEREYIKVVDDGKYLRIEETGGGRIAIKIEGAGARILTLYVPKNERMQGIAGELLALAQREVFSRGISFLDTAFSEELWEMVECLDHLGYTLSSGANVISYEFDKLVEMAESKKVFISSGHTLRYVCIGDLDKEQYKTMTGMLKSRGIIMAQNDILTYSKAYSGVVFDPDDRARVVVFCRHKGDELIVDLVEGSDNSLERVIAYALSNVYALVIENDGIKGISLVTGIISEPFIERLTKVFDSSGLKQRKVCGSVYARKMAGEDTISKEELPKLLDISKDYKSYDDAHPGLLWYWENSLIRYQSEIGWKVCRMKR